MDSIYNKANEILTQMSLDIDLYNLTDNEHDELHTAVDILQTLLAQAKHQPELF